MYKSGSSFYDTARRKMYNYGGVIAGTTAAVASTAYNYAPMAINQATEAVGKYATRINEIAQNDAVNTGVGVGIATVAGLSIAKQHVSDLNDSETPIYELSSNINDSTKIAFGIFALIYLTIVLSK